jgi:hypothetical protein
MYETPYRYNAFSADGKVYSPVLGKMVKLSPKMVRLVHALDEYGFVDPIRDGGTVSTFVALIDRGILRPAKSSRGIHFPATTPAQVWDEAHAEDARRVAEKEAHAECPEQWVQMDEDGAIRHVRQARAGYPIEIEQAGHRFWYIRINGRTPMSAGGTFEEARRAADRFEARRAHAEAAMVIDPAVGPDYTDGAFTEVVQVSTPVPTVNLARLNEKLAAKGLPPVGAEDVERMGCQVSTPARRFEPGDTVQRRGETGPGHPIGEVTATTTSRGEARIAVAFTGMEPIWVRPETLDHATAPAPAPTLADRCCAFVEKGGIATHEDECPRFWKLTPEEAAYRAAVAQVSAPAPTLADDVAALRRGIALFAPADTAERMLAHLDRIAARAPQRATDPETGAHLYLHDCGHVQASGDFPTPTLCYGCSFQGANGWRALYILPVTTH